MATVRSVACGIAALLFLTGCYSTEKASTFAELGPEANTRGFGEMFPPETAEGDFTFGIGDGVGILVQNNPDLTGTHAIRQDGKITLAVVGDVMVAGLTPEQVKRKLESKVAVYMKDAAITVAAVAIVSKRFYVAASSPITGSYIVRQIPYRGDTTLFEIWAAMGSPSSSLDDDTHIKVIRPDPRHPVVKVINIREMLICGYSGGNIQIKPNDIVYLPPTVWGRVAQLTAAIAAPFQGLFYVTGVYSQINTARAIISGDYQFGGGYYYGNQGALSQNQIPPPTPSNPPIP